MEFSSTPNSLKVDFRGSLEKVPADRIGKRQKNKRFFWIDYAKFIGIFLVVFGHQSIPELVFKFVYSFHMPLFFFISGYLFSFDKHKTFWEFSKYRAKQLLIPFFFLGVVTYLYWVFISQRIGVNKENVPFYKPFLGLFYGNAVDGYLLHCIPSWFLPCLFVVENLYYLTFKRIQNRFVGLVFFACLAFLVLRYNPVRLPFGLDVAFSAIIFYGVGNYMKEFLSQLVNRSWLFLLLCASVLFGISAFIAMTNGTVDMREMQYGNYIYFLAGGISGALMVILISMLLTKVFHQSTAVEYIARNTIIILFFQAIVISIINVFTSRILKISTDVYSNAVLFNIVTTALNLLIQVPLMIVLNKYAPFLLGRFSTTNTLKVKNVTN